ncbi:hypothetical protein NFI95_12445 [Acetobacteraceae bacterium KSS8]|uniref:Uncharacterized protein n=1 Tax=Endosaccharibacter trunci TaxID=2812733 RepID=A0ABT1W8N8_9PROT|nr:hypothetical protein [Acetobacteraceae bacterium KSS8]
MPEFTTLKPHDPLPDGPAVVLMHRFEEDDPHLLMMELIVIHANQSEETSRLITRDGTPLPLDEARHRAAEAAKEARIGRLFLIDRTEGPREREILAHDGDHSAGMDGLSDTDEEDGVTGSDMRDMSLNEAPRRF